MTARIVALVVVWAAAMGLAGCTTPSEPSDPPVSSTSSRPPAQKLPQDRDKDAVLAALRRIDLCSVLDAAMTAVSVLPASAEPRARQPFGCAVEGMAYPVYVTVVNMAHDSRLSLPTRVVGGAKSYVREELGNCDVYLPVSFELAIEFSQISDGVQGPCRVVTELAAASVAVLADPEVARVDPRWDACTAFAEVLGPDVDRSKLFVGTELEICQYLAESAEKQASIWFANTLPPLEQPRTATIGGKQVQIYENEDNLSCGVYWSQELFTSRYAPAPDYPVLLTAFDCDGATALAESAMNVLAEPPPDDVEAQHPLFYAPDEPDSPWVGECAYAEGLSDPRRCEPYREVPVPDDVADAWEDAQVMCAVSVDAVGKHFGTRLRPIAVSQDGTYCYFVEPERSIQVEFVVDPGRTVGGRDAREVTVAGHPGFVEGGGGYYQYELSTSSTTDGDASVVLTVRTGPVIAMDTPLPAGTDKMAEAVLTDVLRKYFS